MAHALILGHTIHLEIPDDLYQALRIRAGQTAMTLEQVAAECLSGAHGRQMTMTHTLAGRWRKRRRPVATREIFADSVRAISWTAPVLP